MSNKYEQRKKMIYDFMCDNMYVPMKIKEPGAAPFDFVRSLRKRAMCVRIES